METETEPVIQTTLRLSEDLHYRAKVQAAVLRLSLNEFIVRVIDDAAPPVDTVKS